MQSIYIFFDSVKKDIENAKFKTSIKGEHEVLEESKSCDDIIKINADKGGAVVTMVIAD